MKNILVLAVLIAGAGRARANSALECLQASARSEGCLEGGGREPAPVVAQPVSRRTPGLTVTALKPEKGYRKVPTPAGWRDDEDGTLTTGFFKGLDSGFKTGFGAIVWPAVAGIEASGAPYRENIGTIAFFSLGVILSIPASIIGAVIGAPVGAVAGMIAEKVSPGATKDWFTF